MVSSEVSVSAVGLRPSGVLRGRQGPSDENASADEGMENIPPLKRPDPGMLHLKSGDL